MKGYVPMPEKQPDELTPEKLHLMIIGFESRCGGIAMSGCYDPIESISLRANGPGHVEYREIEGSWSATFINDSTSIDTKQEHSKH